MTAAEKAMQNIGEALDAYFRGVQSEPSTLNAIARINGAYSVERIGEAA
jgi:predicted RNase H-like HicB family nuclease